MNFDPTTRASEILQWLAEALQQVVRAPLCVAAQAQGDNTLYIHTSSPIGQEDVHRILSALSEVSGPDSAATTAVVLNGRPAPRLATRGEQPLRRVFAFPLALDGRVLGTLAIGTWHDFLGQRSLEALKRTATEVGQALKALWGVVAQERNRLEAIVENLIDGLLLCDPQGNILTANWTARRFLGLPANGPAHTRPRLGSDRLGVSEFLQEAVANSQPEFNRIVRVTSPERAVFGVKGRRVRDADGRDIGWLIQIRDITQSWEAERFRNDVLSVASHELHTPLTSMYDAVSLLVEGTLGELNDKQLQLASLLQSDIERLTRLVEELLDVTRYESADYPLERRRSLDVVRTINQVIDKLQYRASRKGLSVVTLVREGLPQLRGDRDRLIQVLENLLDNAVKFTPVGGVIEIGAESQGKHVHVWVRDTGVGIPKEHQKWIFEKFARLHTDDTEESGHGLGLSIAKAIVESWGGRIWVDSKPGQGSTFHFTIPLRPKETALLGNKPGTATVAERRSAPVNSQHTPG